LTASKFETVVVIPSEPQSAICKHVESGMMDDTLTGNNTGIGRQKSEEEQHNVPDLVGGLGGWTMLKGISGFCGVLYPRSHHAGCNGGWVQHLREIEIK
jgi:hypothetical protein